MNDLVSFGGANLPSVKSLSDSLRSIRSDVGSSGMAILKMDKTGCWIFGADGVEVEEDSRWAVNPFSFVHGYIAWGNAEVLAEQMVPISAPLPELPPAPAGAKKGWEMQVGFQLKCIDGEDEGTEVRYSATSVGGKRAVQELGISIADQVDKEPSRPVPVVNLKKDHYSHKQYGKVFTPVFAIVDWVSLDGPSSEAAEPPADEEVPARRRRRRRATA